MLKIITNVYERRIHHQFARKTRENTILIFVNRFEILKNCHKLYF